jgi:hypothetical protein
LPNTSKWLFLCCYRAPDNNDIFELKNLADRLFPNYDQIIIGGDFNLPNIVWSENNCSAFGQLEQELCDLIDD